VTMGEGEKGHEERCDANDVSPAQERESRHSRTEVALSFADRMNGALDALEVEGVDGSEVA
jgi:hypothetical protein